MTAAAQAVLMWTAISYAGFLGHLVGDYLVQNGWMAANKARLIDWRLHLWQNVGLQAATVHAVTWALSVALFMVPASRLMWGAHSAMLAVQACAALGIVHWIQDRRWPVLWYMKHTGKDTSQMWLVIVVDNVWHLLQIAAAAAWIVWRVS